MHMDLNSPNKFGDEYSICYHDIQFPKGPCLPRLPVPGYEVMLPQNATAEIYQEVLKEMKLNEVSSGDGSPMSYCWWFRHPAHQLRLVIYPNILDDFYTSQVVVWDFFHQQYVYIYKGIQGYQDDFRGSFVGMIREPSGIQTTTEKLDGWSFTY